MSRKFELHVGFPKTAEAAAESFMAQLAREGKQGWGCSEVHSVYSETAAVDPHNVPGTLKYLVSRGFSHIDEESDSQVMSDAQWAISTLASMDIDDARLEIEYVFGNLFRRKSDGGGASLRFSRPPEWSREKLHLQDANFIETPNSEIHFILEMDADDEAAEPPTVISIEEAGQILRTYGVDVQQTIEYRSQSMVEANRSDKKLICTAYYDSPPTAERVARRLFVSTRLCEELSERGYTLRLILERILGCFKPIHKTVSSISKEVGTEYALSHV
jgi:hypothetical protein